MLIARARNLLTSFFVYVNMEDSDTLRYASMFSDIVKRKTVSVGVYTASYGSFRNIEYQNRQIKRARATQLIEVNA